MQTLSIVIINHAFHIQLTIIKLWFNFDRNLKYKRRVLRNAREAWGLKTNLRLQIGSFFMINLCLVVIATQFSETKKREMERMRLERARYHSTSTLASSTNTSEPTTCYAEIVKWVLIMLRLEDVSRSFAAPASSYHASQPSVTTRRISFQIHRTPLATG